jgi:actin-related protein 6
MIRVSELRSLALVDYDVVIYECDEYVILQRNRCNRAHSQLPRPVVEAYHSAFAFANMPEFADHVVKRAEYLESGINASRRKFKDWKVEEKERDREVLKGKARYKEEDRTPAPKKITRNKSRPNMSGASRRR